jgi:hypothetical protein
VQIIDGAGPKIAGTRITLYDIMDYLRWRRIVPGERHLLR